MQGGLGLLLGCNEKGGDMRGVLTRAIRMIVLLAVLDALAVGLAGCGGEAEVTVVPQPTPTRTPDPGEE